MRFSFIQLLIVMFLFVTFNGFSATTQTYPDYEFKEFARSPRAAAMGNAFTAVSDDMFAIFYNPAGLNKITEGKITFFPPLIEINKNSVDFVKTLKSVPPELGAAVSELNKLSGKVGYFKFSIFPNYTRHNFSMGIYANSDTNADIEAAGSTPELNLNTTLDIGPMMGLAKSFFNDNLKVGLSAGLIYRGALVKKVKTQDILGQNMFKLGEGQEGLGFDMNFGTMYSLPLLKSLEPTIGIAVLNLIETDFSLKDFGVFGGTESSAKTPPTPLKRTYNIGYSMKLPKLLFIYPLITVDYRHAFDKAGASKDSFAKHFHAGLEVDGPLGGFARLGIHQGYIAGGIGVDWYIIKLEASTYAVEKGVYANQKADRRFMFTLNLAF